jgi:uncharacterized protein (DUF849 family)
LAPDDKREKQAEVSDKSWAPPPLNPYKPLIINVALTGAVPTKDDNPYVPTTPEEISKEALACADAGASIVHIHVRDEDGAPVHDAGLYEEAIAPIKDARPELIVCVTTSGRVGRDPEARMIGLRLPEHVKPDMASLTLGSFNFPSVVSNNPPEIIEALLKEMKEQGIKPELEVFEEGMVNTAKDLTHRGFLDHRPYFNILLGSRGSAPAFVGTLAHIVDRLPADAEWAAAGIGLFQHPMIIAGCLMGGNVRTGLEDAPLSAKGEPRTNVQAVEEAVAAARLVGREIATPSETRVRLGLPEVTR